MAPQRNDRRNGSEAPDGQPQTDPQTDEQADEQAERGGQPQSEVESFGRSFTGRPGPLTQWGAEGGEEREAAEQGGSVGRQRSDQRLYEQVCDVLTDAHDLDASHITVSVQNGAVTLSGDVADRLSKRRAEDHIERMIGVKGVINDLRVPSSKESALSGVIE